MKDQQYRCLLIESNDDDAELSMAYISRYSKNIFRVDRSTSISESIQRINSVQYDLIITELYLTDSQGLDTIRVLCESYQPDRSPAIVVFTRADDSQVAFDAIQECVQDVLIKDQIIPQTFVRVLRQSIYRRIRDRIRYQEALSMRGDGTLKLFELIRRADVSITGVSPTEEQLNAIVSSCVTVLKAIDQKVDDVLKDFKDLRGRVASHEAWANQKDKSFTTQFGTVMEFVDQIEDLKIQQKPISSLICGGELPPLDARLRSLETFMYVQEDARREQRKKIEENRKWLISSLAAWVGLAVSAAITWWTQRRR